MMGRKDDLAEDEGWLDRESDEGWRDLAEDEGRLDRAEGACKGGNAQGERRFCPQEEDRGVRGLWRGMLARGRRRFGRDENGRGLLARGAAGAKRHWEAMWLAATLCVLVALLMAFAPRALPVRRFSARARVAENGLIRQGEEVRVDLNSADSALLSGLPGIGDALAQRIVAYRVANGPFLSVESLTQVPGIGPGKLAKLTSRVAVTR
ncbi:MAG: helix-hairpin-helix domain-containing protein [Clostridia bacterium]